MTHLGMIRHAPTDWNEDGRIQGRTDTPLSAAGTALAAGWSLPETLRGWLALTSPLARTRDTAAMLGLANATADERLIEMDWGLWAGRTLEELRDELGDAMAENEARGLDFRPVGGESPRDVQARLGDLFRERAGGENTIAVSHRGVMRAALGMATGWDFLSRPPLKLTRSSILVLALDDDGGCRLDPCGPLSLDAEQ
ncbi:MAG: histidine phosphatase family protein [Rhodospirillales bacterium]|nr:histidine phosphatase family protein [Rhodospirillales bacterium]